MPVEKRIYLVIKLHISEIFEKQSQWWKIIQNCW